MDVESASRGRALRVWGRGSWSRVRLFARHPYSEYRRYVEKLGYDYPIAVVTLVDAVLLLMAVVAVVQRYCAGYFPSALPLLALLLVFLFGPPCVIFDLPPHPLFITTLTVSSTALFLAQPVAVDAAPLLLIVGAGEIAAITTIAGSLAAAAVMGAELAFFSWIGHIQGGFAWYGFGLMFGWMTGQLLNYQRRYLYQEREHQEIRARSAADEERRRIAREVHDVIAHSLSITLLHVTAARHALQTDRDVDDAVEALTDAERLGRQAMADIRRTVGLLGARASSSAPEPGLDDIGALVTDFVRAGVRVEYRTDGDPSAVSAGLGLALYRICQESLANIAKHAPGASARLRIAFRAGDIAVTVTNTPAPAAVARPGAGMGISGMRQRAQLLGGTFSAGPAHGGWLVRARLPLGHERADHERTDVVSATAHDAAAVQPGCILSAAEESLRPLIGRRSGSAERPAAWPPGILQEGS